MNDWWVLNVMSFIFWCIFSFTWIVRIIWSCWITMVMLLVFIYVIRIYVVGEFPYMLLVLNCWCKHVLKYVGGLLKCMKICIVVDYVICSCIISCWWRILLYSIIRGDYSGWLWCSVGIRGDGLGGDLVPHAYRCCV